MVGSVSKVTGYWKVDDCKSKKGFICKRNIGERNISKCLKSQGKGFSYQCENCDLHLLCPIDKDSQVVVSPTTMLPKAFYKFGNDSYKLVAQKMRWQEARRQCQADDSDLVSILNPVIQAFITLQISKHNEPVWIGLNNNVVKHLPITTSLLQHRYCI